MGRISHYRAGTMLTYSSSHASAIRSGRRILPQRRVNTPYRHCPAVQLLSPPAGPSVLHALSTPITSMYNVSNLINLTSLGRLIRVRYSYQSINSRDPTLLPAPPVNISSLHGIRSALALGLTIFLFAIAPLISTSRIHFNPGGSLMVSSFLSFIFYPARSL